MAKFALMHMGFEKPDPDMMKKWQAWFEKIAPHSLDNLGFRGGIEISHEGETALGMSKDAITGISVIEAEDLDAARALCADNPFVQAIRIYQIAEHGGS